MKMPQVYECEECGKIIDEREKWLEVEIMGNLNGFPFPLKVRVHATCLDPFRKKHPRG